MNPNNEVIRQRLIYSIEHTENHEQVLREAKDEVTRLERLVNQRLWGDARKLIKGLPKRPSVYVFVWRLYSNLGQTQKLIEAGYEETGEAIRIIQEGTELMRSQLPWTEMRRCLSFASIARYHSIE